MENIEAFLKQKMSDRSIKLDELAKLAGFSRSTVYRVLKGRQKPTAELQQKIVSILKFSTEEKHSFEYFIRRSEIDKGLLIAREQIHKLFFHAYSDKEQHDEIVFLFHEDDTYVRSYEQILSNIREAAKGENFLCKMNIINCIAESRISPIHNLIKDFVNAEKQYVVEHLINFCESDYTENLNVLKTIISMFQFENYDLRYADADEIQKVENIFNNLVLISYSFRSSDKSFEKFVIISFLDDRFSECYASDSKKLYTFFLNNYQYVKSNYKNVLMEQRNINIFEDFFLNLEKDNIMYVIKPNPCYNKIPFTVYESVRNRSTPSDVRRFLKPFGDFKTDNDNEKALSHILGIMEARTAVAFKQGQIDVYSKKGLYKFAMTGVLTDYIEYLPPLNKDEVNLVLTNLKLTCNKTKNYKMFLVDEDQMLEEYIFSVIKGYGLLVTFSTEVYKNGYVRNCLIKHSEIAAVFSDFIENYVPEKLAITQTEMMAYLDYLIELER